MVETVFSFGLIAIGIGLILYAFLGRILHIHRPLKWEGGGQLGLAGELNYGLLLFFSGVSIYWRFAVWVVPIVALFFAGLFLHWRANRNHRANQDQLRQANLAKYPVIFDCDPLDDLDSTNNNEFDLYDAGACTYLGKASRSDLQALIDRFADLPDQGPNDIFLLFESLDMVPNGGLSKKFISMLTDAFEECDYLILRWMPTRGSVESRRDE